MRKRTILSVVVLAATSYAVMANDKKGNVQEMTEAERETFISSIEFVETEQEPELGFEVLQYLPNDFDPYKGMIFDMRDIHFEEIKDDGEMDLKTELHLPEEFNPYVGQ